MDVHKTAKEAALKKLMDLMDEGEANDLRGLKAKPDAAVLEIDATGDDANDGEPSDFKKAWDELRGGPKAAPAAPEGADGEDGEPTDDDKARIADLYRRYCSPQA